ncbi:MAG: succinylglutamate desuccinylase/aspartoacylase family protein [Deltaproteobacteria bacterium]|nr:succinylglutamate desuccinylase/aspartoacylase family protein [Deltaproteobacteria bacterium]
MWSSDSIHQELERFTLQMNNLAKVLTVKELAPYVYTISPENPILHQVHDRTLPLTISALIHGDETGGLASINDFLNLLISSPHFLEIPIGLALGNPEAALKNSRYLERDLNRSFAFPEKKLHEPIRAAQLEKLLRISQYYIDLHQTSQKSSSPFFIFPYTAESYQFARELLPGIPIVTHWKESFSSEGCCSDEFHNQNGGTGITIEMGLKGIDPYQSSFGFFLITRALGLIRRRHDLIPYTANLTPPAKARAPLYTWSAVRRVHLKDQARLDHGWYNFREVSKGDTLGQIGGKPMLAEASGKILFPKYSDPAPASSAEPYELYRIIRKISEKELPDSR